MRKKICNAQLNHWFDSICKGLVLIIYGAIISYLALLSILGTSVEGQSKVYYIMDTPLNHLFLIAVMSIILIISKRFISHKKYEVGSILENRRVIIFLYLLYILVGLFLIFSAGLMPFSDSQKVFTVAEQMLVENFESFQPGGYMHRYPFQSGFTLFVYYHMKIFGEKTYLILEVYNLIAIVVIFYFLSSLCNKIWISKTAFSKFSFTLINILFLPIFFYTTLIYGNTISLACAVMALYFEVLFIDKEKCRYILFSSFFISIGIILKSNSLIIFVAMMCLLSFMLIRKNNKFLYAFGLFFMIIIYILGSQSTSIHLKSIIKIPIPRGMPKTTWVMMGLQDGGAAPGYFTGSSVGLYEDNDYNYDQTNEEALKEIRLRINIFSEDWRSGLEFFGKKIAAQWNEPIYQCINLTNNREATGIFGKEIQKQMLGKVGELVFLYCNSLQTFVWVGIIFYIIFRRKEISFVELIFAIIFIGGFIFHLFWEGKSQYVIGYVLLQLPYVVIGYKSLFLWLSNMYDVIKQNDMHIEKRTLYSRVFIVVVCSLLLMIGGRRIAKTEAFQYTLGVHSSGEELQQFLLERKLFYDWDVF